MITTHYEKHPLITFIWIHLSYFNWFIQFPFKNSYKLAVRVNSFIKIAFINCVAFDYSEYLQQSVSRTLNEEAKEMAQQAHYMQAGLSL